jgi:hypothetical protein
VYGLDLCPGLLDHFIDELAMLLKGQMKRKSEPRKWTTHTVSEARALYKDFHARVREARQFCNRNKRSTGQTAAQEDARLHPKRPKMPKEVIVELKRDGARTCKSPATLAHEWTALTLNRTHPGLNATAEYLRRHILNADTKADTDSVVDIGFLRF